MRQLIQRIAKYLYRHSFASEVRADIQKIVLQQPLIFGGDATRVRVAGSAKVMNALFNVTSGTISVGEDVFFGHNVCLITGSHDPKLRGSQRKDNWPETGYDLVIHEGVWVGSNVTILGPVSIGAHAVIAAGALVCKDVRPGVMVGGVPAKVIKEI